MNTYYLILTALQVLSLGVVLAKHGEKREERYNFWTTLIATIIIQILVIMAIRGADV
jgi:hypothetical protein